MTYLDSGAGALDYLTCGYGQSRLHFRGPERSLDNPYAVYIGGTETYGKYVARPFPSLVEEMSGRTAVNLGVVNAGIETFRSDQTVLRIARGAEYVLLQVMGPEYVSNRYFSVHPRRNDRFIRATAHLQSLYPDVDFTEFHFVGHLLNRLRRKSPKKFSRVMEECQREWVTSCVGLVRRIGRPTIAVRLGAPSVSQKRVYDFLDAKVLAPLEKRCVSLITVRPDQKVLAEGTSGMVFSQLDAFSASDLPNPTMHLQIARSIYKELQRSGLG